MYHFIISLSLNDAAAAAAAAAPMKTTINNNKHLDKSTRNEIVESKKGDRVDVTVSAFE